MSEKEKMLQGQWYDANFDETLLRDRSKAELLCYDFNMARPGSDEQQAALKKLLGDDRAMLSSELGGDTRKSSGSEDFAHASHVVPSLMVALAAGQPQSGHEYPAHHPKTLFDENVLPIGAAVYAMLAMEAMKM